VSDPTILSAPQMRAAPLPGVSSRCRDYQRVADTLAWISAHFEEQPTLADIASRTGASPCHFQRLFSRWVGLSPKKYVQYLTLERAKASLGASRSVLAAALAAGLSGPGRLHDLFVNVEAVTPGEYKRGGAGLVVRHGIHNSPFGPCLLMHTERGICGLAFVDQGDDGRTLAYMGSRWPNAHLIADPDAGTELAARVFAARGDGDRPLTVLLHGTPFQIQVWKALLRIPPGTVASYQTLANYIGKPDAARAVGTANGANPISYLIPCHRVIRKSGALGGYRWGLGRKLAMLSLELN
jgi:AraC family transcriptional regulator, regulatory protein of adaptative response / methylated-DNA-[protein]-cysteine methyltransferase